MEEVTSHFQGGDTMNIIYTWKSKELGFIICYAHYRKIYHYNAADTFNRTRKLFTGGDKHQNIQKLVHRFL